MQNHAKNQWKTTSGESRGKNKKNSQNHWYFQYLGIFFFDPDNIFFWSPSNIFLISIIFFFDPSPELSLQDEDAWQISSQSIEKSDFPPQSMGHEVDRFPKISHHKLARSQLSLPPNQRPLVFGVLRPRLWHPRLCPKHIRPRRCPKQHRPKRQ